MGENYDSVGSRVVRHFRHYIDGLRHVWLRGNYSDKDTYLTQKSSIPTLCDTSEPPAKCSKPSSLKSSELSSSLGKLSSSSQKSSPESSTLGTPSSSSSSATFTLANAQIPPDFNFSQKRSVTVQSHSIKVKVVKGGKSRNVGDADDRYFKDTDPDELDM